MFVAASADDAEPSGWAAIDDYDGKEATVLFGAPPGDDFRECVRVLLHQAVKEADALGFESLLAHWRAGWDAAESILIECGFRESAPGIWRRPLEA